MARVKEVPVVRLKGMSGSEFKESLNGLRKRESQARPGTYEGVNLSRDLMMNLDTKLFIGQELPAREEGGESRIPSVPGTMAVNLYTMTNPDAELLDAMGVQLSGADRRQLNDGVCKYSGGTNDGVTYNEDGKSLPPTPVGMDVVYDIRGNSANKLDDYTVTPYVDFTALGNASIREQNAAREAKGKEPLDTQRPRLAVSVNSPVTKDGLGGMNADRVAQNIAKCAAADYLMRAPLGKARREEAIKACPTTDEVKQVADLYNDTFSKFVKEIATKGCNGVPLLKTTGMATDKNGTVLTCPSLKDMGLKAVEANGATVLAVVGGEDGKADRKAGLKQFNDVFNARWKQVINERVGDDKSQLKYSPNVVNMGNAVSLNSRAVSVRNPMDRDQKTGLVLVQPSMDYGMTPIASSLGKSVSVVTHQLSAEDAYPEEIREAAAQLATAFDTPSPEPEVAKEANMKQFESICKGAGLNAKAMLEKSAEAQNEGPEGLGA